MMLPLASDPGRLIVVVVGFPLALLLVTAGIGALIAKWGRRKWWSMLLLAPSLLFSCLLLLFAIAVGKELWGPVLRGHSFAIFVAFLLLAPLPANLYFLHLWWRPRPTPKKD